MLVANGANPRARDSDAKTYLGLAAVIGSDSRDFLCRAKRLISRVEEAERGLPFRPFPGRSPAANAELQREVEELRRELQPFRVTEDVRRVIRERLYRCSVLAECSREVAATVDVLEPLLPLAHLRRIIKEQLSPCGFDARTHEWMPDEPDIFEDPEPDAGPTARTSRSARRYRRCTASRRQGQAPRSFRRSRATIRAGSARVLLLPPATCK